MRPPVKRVSHVHVISPLCQKQTYDNVSTIFGLIGSAAQLSQNTLERMWTNKAVWTYMSLIKVSTQGHGRISRATNISLCVQYNPWRRLWPGNCILYPQYLQCLQDINYKLHSRAYSYMYVYTCALQFCWVYITFGCVKMSPIPYHSKCRRVLGCRSSRADCWNYKTIPYQLMRSLRKYLQAYIHMNIYMNMN